MLVFLKIEIEVENSDDAVIAAKNGADIVMFDNMNPDEALKTLNILKNEVYVIMY